MSKEIGKTVELKIEHLSKSYDRGKKKALEDFSVNLTPGIYALLGPNGAGKSTLMNILTDSLRADKGTVYYNGEDILKLGSAYREVLGYMPQQQGLYEEFTAVRFMEYIAALKGIKKKVAKEEIRELLTRVGLENEMHKKTGGFSGGMKQRLLIAQALLGRPSVLLMDEPTAGLDPNERIRLRNFISEIAGDKIVIFATHVVSDIEFIAKEVLLINHGELVQKGRVSELLSMIEGKVFEIGVNDKEVEKLKSEYKVSNVYRMDEQCVVRILSDTMPEGKNVREVKPNLEDLYLYVTA
ncbi:MAG: ABC transporter ATP-binding protein [Lachnospiraceae bacterium]|nr:ABC transporter ATP-binding protein [Lachnospiraceae bacterium]